MTDELKPCPFCGSEGKLKVADGILDDYTMFYCYCPNGKCIAGGTDWFRSREEAIEAWNTRAERTVSKEELESTWRCPSCGHSFDSNEGWGKYTACCGAKVVS